MTEIEELTDEEKREAVRLLAKKKEKDAKEFGEGLDATMNATNDKEWMDLGGGYDIFTFEKAGDMIEGVLIGVRTETGKYKNNAYDFSTTDGMRTVFGSKIINDRLNEKHIGKQVRIIFNGKKKALTSNQTYNDFTVQVKKD